MAVFSRSFTRTASPLPAPRPPPHESLPLPLPRESCALPRPRPLADGASEGASRLACRGPEATAAPALGPPGAPPPPPPLAEGLAWLPAARPWLAGEGAALRAWPPRPPAGGWAHVSACRSLQPCRRPRPLHPASEPTCRTSRGSATAAEAVSLAACLDASSSARVTATRVPTRPPARRWASSVARCVRCSRRRACSVGPSRRDASAAGGSAAAAAGAGAPRARAAKPGGSCAGATTARQQGQGMA